MGADNGVVFIVPNENFRDEEYSDTNDQLVEAGIETKVAALDAGECKGIAGTTIEADLTLDEVDPSQFDAVILVGGVGVEQYLNDDTVHTLVESFVKLGKLVAAICWAPAILANAGVLNGKKVTAWDGCKPDLEKGGATYTGENVTIDGKIITALGPDQATEFGKTIVKALVGDNMSA